MITEEPVITLADVQIEVPQNDGFILGRHRLTVHDLGPGTDLTAWVSVAGGITQMSAQRGGKRSGLGVKIDVGTLTVTIKDPDLTVDPNLAPNRPIRFVEPYIVDTQAGVLNHAENGQGRLLTGGVPNGTYVSSGAASQIDASDMNISDAETAIRFTRSGTGATMYGIRLPYLAPNTQYTVRLVVRHSTAVVGSLRYRPDIASATGQGTATPLSLGAGVTTHSLWQFTTTATVPTDPGIVFTRPSGGASGETFDLTNAIVVEGPEAPVWFDGSKKSDEGPGFLNEWAGAPYPGTPWATPSIQYPILHGPLNRHFTGKIADVDYELVYDRRTKRMVKLVTIVAVDAVQAHSNTQRYGAISGHGGEPWEARLERLAVSAVEPVVVPYVAPGEVVYDLASSGTDSWGNFGTLPAGISESAVARTTLGFLDRSQVYRETVTTVDTLVKGGTVGITRSITGLTVGRTYTVAARGGYYGVHPATDLYVPNRYRLAVLEIGPGAPVTFWERGYPYEFPVFQFVATQTTHTLAVLLAEDVNVLAAAGLAEALGIEAITVTEWQTQSSYLMADQGVDGSLAEHFDLACLSAGAWWWVDSDGFTQFSTDLASVPEIPQFTEANYLQNPVRAYDTRAVVNDLSVTQHTIGVVDEDTGELGPIETDHNYKDITSIASWGARSEDVDLAVYDQDVYSGSLKRRSRELLAEHAQPELTIYEITWNAQENWALASQLDIYSPIDVVLGGEVQESRVISLKHVLTPTRWLITIGLIRR